MNEINVLRLMWSFKWIFIVIFTLVFLSGSVYIMAYSKKQSHKIELNNYAFFMLQKLIHQSSDNHNAILVNNKILNPILNRLLAAPLQVDEDIAHVVKNSLHIIAPNGYSTAYSDVYWFVYPAQSQTQAIAIADFIQAYIAHSQEVQALRAYLENFKSLFNQNSLWSVSVRDMLENGFFITSSPQLTFTKNFKELSIAKDSLSSYFTTRSMWILLCVSAFVLATLGVFLGAFVRTQWQNIKS